MSHNETGIVNRLAMGPKEREELREALGTVRNPDDGQKLVGHGWVTRAPEAGSHAHRSEDGNATAATDASGSIAEPLYKALKQLVSNQQDDMPPEVDSAAWSAAIVAIEKYEAASATRSIQALLLSSVRELHEIIFDGMTADHDHMIDALKRARLAMRAAEATNPAWLYPDPTES